MNRRTRIRDQERAPVAADLKRVMREKARFGEGTFALTADVAEDGSYRDYDGINGEPTEFEWNIFPGFTMLQHCGKVTDPLSRLGVTPETFTGRILFMSMFNDISCDNKGNEEECLANAKVVSILAKKFGIGQWSFIGPGSEKKVVFHGRE